MRWLFNQFSWFLSEIHKKIVCNNTRLGGSFNTFEHFVNKLLWADLCSRHRMDGEIATQNDLFTLRPNLEDHPPKRNTFLHLLFLIYLFCIKNQTWAECSWINQHINDVSFPCFFLAFLLLVSVWLNPQQVEEGKSKAFLGSTWLCKRRYPDPPMMIKTNETSLNYFQ